MNYCRRPQQKQLPADCRRRQRFDSAALAAAFQPTGLGYFSYDPVSRMTNRSEGFERLWPFQNGVPQPEKE